MTTFDVDSRAHAEVERLVDRLAEPRTAAALHTLLDNVELLAVVVDGLDSLARKGEVIGDTLGEVLHEVRAAGRATGLDVRTTSHQLATLIPTLAEASPAINRILESPIVEPEPIEVLSETAVALVAGLRAAQSRNVKVGLGGLMKAVRDDDVQRGLGFLVEVAKAFGQHLAAQPNRPSAAPPAP
ncbi:MAG: DUF1641 domain-containing protein [Ilumatobacteraceae bacterium]|nr:DUF1641 domain-containing protein [Acidimicrobiales bacterium]